MSKENQPTNNTSDREIMISRVLNAPRELVFKVFTEPEHVAKWWGPNGFTNTISKMEVEPGGVWELVMHGPDGTDYKNKSIYTEVVKPERIVFRHMAPDFTATINFVELGNKTELTWRMLFDTAEEFQRVVRVFKADEGLKQNVEKLGAYLADLPDENVFTISRTFNASRELVFKAWTEPEHFAAWWGPKGFEMSFFKMDVKLGGKLHYRMHSPDGAEMWGIFVYHEIVAPERIVFVNSFSDKDGNITRPAFSPEWPLEIRNTLTLTEQNGKTTVTLSGGPINASSRELDIFRSAFTGMQQGFAGTFAQLEEHLATMA